MTTATLWQTDDCCPWCGALLRQYTRADGSVIDECECGWSVTWQAGPDGGER
jgi:hypothetical protein